ncbi:hypothetical protein [Candidatus Similichlamydia epinepheli]|uniref:hypothetical protein n=1 Tax=Candidatus Similichlamydia epinepheli TaxID=1903953 RepID=UPI000D37D377|nr:hypothetical protein [Candidatus Similichlamydia epinepheli]
MSPTYTSDVNIQEVSIETPSTIHSYWNKGVVAHTACPSYSEDAYPSFTIFRIITLTEPRAMLWNEDLEDVISGGSERLTREPGSEFVTEPMLTPVILFSTNWNVESETGVNGSDITNTFATTLFERVSVQPTQPENTQWNTDITIASGQPSDIDYSVTSGISPIILTANSFNQTQWNIDLNLFTIQSLHSGESLNVPSISLISSNVISSINWNFDPSILSYGGDITGPILTLPRFMQIMMPTTIGVVSSWNSDAFDSVSGSSFNPLLITVPDLNLFGISTNSEWNEDVDDHLLGSDGPTWTITATNIPRLTPPNSTLTSWNSDTARLIDGMHGINLYANEETFNEVILLYQEPISTTEVWNLPISSVVSGSPIINSYNLLTTFAHVSLSPDNLLVTYWNTDVDNYMNGSIDLMTTSDEFIGNEVSLTSPTRLTNVAWNLDVENTSNGSDLQTIYDNSISPTEITLIESITSIFTPNDIDNEIFGSDNSIRAISDISFTRVSIPPSESEDDSFNVDSDVHVHGGIALSDTSIEFAGLSIYLTQPIRLTNTTWNEDLETSVNGYNSDSTYSLDLSFTAVILQASDISTYVPSDINDETLGSRDTISVDPILGITNVILPTRIPSNDSWNIDIISTSYGSENTVIFDTFLLGSDVNLPETRTLINTTWNIDSLHYDPEESQFIDTSFTEVSLPESIISTYQPDDINDQILGSNSETIIEITNEFTNVTLSAGNIENHHWNSDLNDESIGGIDRYIFQEINITEIQLTPPILIGEPWNRDTAYLTLGSSNVPNNTLLVNISRVQLTTPQESFVWINRDVDHYTQGGNNELNIVAFESIILEPPSDHIWNLDINLVTIPAPTDEILLSHLFTNVTLPISTLPDALLWNSDTNDVTMGSSYDTDTTTFTSISLSPTDTFAWTTANSDPEAISSGSILETERLYVVEEISLSDSLEWGIVGTDNNFIQLPRQVDEDIDTYTLGATGEFTSYFYENEFLLGESWNTNTVYATRGGVTDNEELTQIFIRETLPISNGTNNNWNLTIESVSENNITYSSTTPFVTITISPRTNEVEWNNNVDVDHISFGGSGSTTSISEITNVSITPSGPWGELRTDTTFIQVDRPWNTNVDLYTLGSTIDSLMTYFDGTPIVLEFYWNDNIDITTRGGITDSDMLSSSFTNVNLTTSSTSTALWNIDTEDTSIGGDAQADTTTFTAIAPTSSSISGTWSNEDPDDLSDGGIRYTTSISEITNVSIIPSGPWGELRTDTTFVQVDRPWNTNVDLYTLGSTIDSVLTYFDGTPIELPQGWNINVDGATSGGIFDNDLLSDSFDNIALIARNSVETNWNIDTEDISIGGDEQTDTTTFTAVSLTSGVTSGIWNRDTDDVSDGGAIYTTSVSVVTNVSLTSSGPWGSVSTDTLFVNVDRPWNTNVDLYTLGSTTDIFITYFEGTPIELPFHWNRDTDITTLGGIVDDNMLSTGFINVNLTASATEVSEWNVDIDNASIGGDEQTNTVTFTALALTSGVTSGIWNRDTDNTPQLSQELLIYHYLTHRLQYRGT